MGRRVTTAIVCWQDNHIVNLLDGSEWTVEEQAWFDKVISDGSWFNEYAAGPPRI